MFYQGIKAAIDRSSHPGSQALHEAAMNDNGINAAVDPRCHPGSRALHKAVRQS